MIIDHMIYNLTAMSPLVASQQNNVFSKISRIPDLLSDDGSILSLYTDSEQVLHLQCRLRKSGSLILFPVTFRLVNRYISGDYTLAEIVQKAPCQELLMVTRRHNILEIPKDTFDLNQLSFASKHYPQIRYCKIASVDEIRRSLHSCMRG